MGLVFDKGMEALAAMLEAEREAICGPRYEHVDARDAQRHGHAKGRLVLGGRRVDVARPRVRSSRGEHVLPSWQAFAATDPLNERAVEQIVVGVSTRNYERSLEATPLKSSGVSKSSVSRRFVAQTAAKMAEWAQRDLSKLGVVVLMLDGIHFAEHVVLVALGIDKSGNKHVLGLMQGATENTASCQALLNDIRERGLDTDAPLLVVIDGGKALRKAVRETFSRALVQRCRVHKKRNVLDQLPEKARASVAKSLDQAWAQKDEARAKRMLHNLARGLKRAHPAAAASIQEGLEETLTVTKLAITEALAKTLVTTNPIENIMGNNRRICRNVKNWRDGEMVLRWLSTASIEAEKKFRRVKGYKAMPQLINALSQHSQLDSVARTA